MVLGLAVFVVAACGPEMLGQQDEFRTKIAPGWVVAGFEKS